MKNTIKQIIGVILVLIAVTACSPQEIEGIDQNALPVISESDITITLEGKTAYFHLDKKECVPVWIIGKKTLTGNDAKNVFWQTGAYTVEVKAYNRNGLSSEAVSKDFVIE